MIFDSLAFNISLSVFLLISSYLIGAIPFGLIVGKIFFKKDIREHGSHNIGSTNAIRVLGKKGGIPVFILDVLKGAIMIIIVKYILEFNGIWTSPIPVLFYGVAAILGHVFPVYLKFKGGKAVATSLGMALALTPLAAVLCLIAFFITLKISGFVSLSSTFAALTVIITVYLLYFFGFNTYSNFGEFILSKPSIEALVTFSLVAILIIFKHRKNYIRIINGTENSFKKNKKV